MLCMESITIRCGRFGSRLVDFANIEFMGESFRRTFSGCIKSSAGYSVQMEGRTTLRYRDESGEMILDAELLGPGEFDIALFLSSIPDRPGRPRDLVAGRVVKAFAAEGISVDVDEH